MMEKTDETIPSREELAVFIEEAAVSVTNNYEEAPAVLMVDDAVIARRLSTFRPLPHQH